MAWGVTPILGTINDELYTQQYDYDANGNLIYGGLAEPGTATSKAKWQICKITYSGTGNLTGILWAGGARTFVNIWNDRALLSYS